MSDILIKGMEMPTDHPLWIVVHSDGTVEANEVSASRPVGWQTLRNAAIPVPPHGRLIQDDALDKIEHYHDGTFGLTNYERGWNAALLLCKKRIEAAPTIIPADQETAHERI